MTTPHRETDDWMLRLRELAADVRAAVRAEPADLATRAQLLHVGPSDLTYGIDGGTEVAATAWFEREAARGALSLFTEDSGWRHAPEASADFDHGGPRIVIDPIDGTRNLMLDLRSAWTEVAWCPPGADEPRASDVAMSLLAELPDRRAGAYRVLAADAEGHATLELRAVDDDRVLDAGPLRSDPDDHALEHRVLSFFRYEPRWRPRVAAIEADFFARLERAEGIDSRHCFDDQYISNAGQLALLALGRYRFVCDLRAYLSHEHGEPAVTSKPYDVAGALHLARAAGCVVEAPDGSQLDFPLDGTTPVSWVGYANPVIADRLRPHLLAALGAS